MRVFGGGGFGKVQGCTAISDWFASDWPKWVVLEQLDSNLMLSQVEMLRLLVASGSSPDKSSIKCSADILGEQRDFKMLTQEIRRKDWLRCQSCKANGNGSTHLETNMSSQQD